MFFLTILLLGISIAIHEFAHAFAMKQCGIPIREIGIGLKVRGISFFWYSKFFSGAKIILSPFIFFAYVRPTLHGEEKTERLPYKDKALINGAGIWGNLVFGLLMLFFSFFTQDISFRLGIPMIKPVIFLIAVIAVLWVGRRIFCAYILPIVSLAMFGLVIALIVKSPTGTLSGPIGIVDMVRAEAFDIGSVFSLSGVLSLGLACFNVLPIFPVDGGRIISDLLQKVSKGLLVPVFKASGVATLLFLLGLAFCGDIINLFK